MSSIPIKKSRRTIFSKEVFEKHFLEKYASYKNTYNYPDPIPLYVHILLLKVPHNNKGDAFLLYNILNIYNSINPLYKSKIVSISIKDIKELTGWNTERIVSIRRLLLDLNLIQEIKIRDNGKFVKHLLLITDVLEDENCKKFNRKVNAEIQKILTKNRVEEPGSGFPNVGIWLPGSGFPNVAPYINMDNNKLLSNLHNKKRKKIKEKKQKNAILKKKEILPKKSQTKNFQTSKETFPKKFQTKNFQTSWEEWKRFRKEIKAPLTPTSINRQIKFLSNYNEEIAISIIERSIINGWRGLFPPNGDHSKQTNKLRPGSGLSHSRTEEEIKELYGRVDLTL